MTIGIEPDPSFELLRLDHRSEQAPARLRQSVLERLKQAEASPMQPLASPDGPARWRARRDLSLGVAAVALLGAVLLRLPASEREGTASGRVGPEPTPVEMIRATPAQPRPAPRSTPVSPAPTRPCPIDELLGGLSRDALADTPRPPPDADRIGLSWHTLSLPTSSCGPLPRHFLQLVPPGTPPVYRGRVLILIPGSPGSPETLALETRWYFEALARERKAVTVYAKAMQEPRPSTPDIIVGGWQTDAGAHPQVDDEAYLDRIVLDLARRGVIGGGNEVWLVGAGSGAVMALSAAARHPERYAGVAALMPERLDALPASGLSGPRLGRRLERVLFVVQGRPADAWGAELEARSKEWALELGAPEGPTPGSPRAVLSPRGAGVAQLDLGSGASGAPGVRVLMLEPGVDPFPPPGGADALSLAASRQRPDAVNGAEEVWRFLGGD
jgi:pimeloyl-ACP methyl ester carboxylesterase